MCGSICKVQEIRQELHLLALGFQTGVIAVELGHLRCEVPHDALNDVHGDSVQTGVIAERMPAAVKVFDRDGASASCWFARGDNVAFLFQKCLDAVGNAAAVMQIHLGVNWQDVFGIVPFVWPLSLKLLKVFGQGRHDRDVHADLGLAHLFTANNHESAW